jgi:hypothetical protein
VSYVPSNPDITQAMRVSQDTKAPIAIVIYLDADCRLHAASYGQNKALCAMGKAILDKSWPAIQANAASVVQLADQYLRKVGK